AGCALLAARLRAARLLAVAAVLLGSGTLRALDPGSHLAAMAEVELLTLAAPLLLLTGRVRTAQPLPSGAARALAGCASLVLPGAVWAWHLPLLGAGEATVLRPTALLAGGLLLWATVTSPALTAGLRLVVLVVAHELLAVLGLALLLTAGAGPLLSDVRAAGLLMLLADAAVAVPLARCLLREHRATHPLRPSPSAPLLRWRTT
ncbi:MAG: hypothetical protein JWM64_1255, partial [Frankiales bacterium]|nr:hypothetical protein [Frankiales bacterium]